MKKIFISAIIGILFPLFANAQLSKLMSEFHGQEWVTVTLLDKNLYGLYKKNTLTPPVEDMLKKLDEINFLNINLAQCPPEVEAGVTSKFKPLLNNPNKYKLIKSHSGQRTKQFVYIRNNNEKVSDLVVWNENNNRLDIIELRGDIQLDKIAMLAKALNVKGVNSLSLLSSGNTAIEDDDEMWATMDDLKEMLKIANEMRNNKNGDLGLDFGLTDLMGNMFNSVFSMAQMGNVFGKLGNNLNITSNAVQVTKENGKTKIKIDSQNSDLTYIIDGKEIDQKKIEMPENIRDINIIPDKEDFKKSYLFIISENKIGEFISYKNGILTFKYEQQEYKFNLEKAKDALLIVDGTPSHDLPDRSAILQIRPLSKIEKENKRLGSAEVMINTK